MITTTMNPLPGDLPGYEMGTTRTEICAYGTAVGARKK
jgi:hypothetical protein